MLTAADVQRRVRQMRGLTMGEPALLWWLQRHQALSAETARMLVDQLVVDGDLVRRGRGQAAKVSLPPTARLAVAAVCPRPAPGEVPPSAPTEPEPVDVDEPPPSKTTRRLRTVVPPAPRPEPVDHRPTLLDWQADPVSMGGGRG
jgi:hypothetical protein